MDHLILPEGVKPWMKTAYDAPEPEWYENIPDQGVSYLEFYKRVDKWDKDDVWTKPKVVEDLLGGVEEGAE